MNSTSVHDGIENEILPGANGIIWLIYIACLIPFTMITGYFFYTHRFYESMKNVAYLLIGALALNTLLMFTMLTYGAFNADFVEGVITGYNPNPTTYIPARVISKFT